MMKGKQREVLATILRNVNYVAYISDNEPLPTIPILLKDKAADMLGRSSV